MRQRETPPRADGRKSDKAPGKAANRGLLLGLLRRRGQASRAGLAKESGLTKVTVSSQVAELIGLGVVREAGAGASELGRKPLMLEIDGAAGRALGLAVSTESIRVLEIDAAGAVARDETLPLAGRSPATVAEAVSREIGKARRRCARTRHGLLGVGVALPGAVDRDSGRVLRSAKLDWTEVPFREMLGRRRGGALFVGNDAALAAVAERELYAPGTEDFVCLLVDEGIGSGAYLDGVAHRGRNGLFGEVGHMTIVHGGPRCPCGNLGCWDLYGSELALRLALGAARKGPPPTPAELLELAADRPAWSRRAFADFAAYLATGIASVVNAMAPSILVVNSAVLAASPPLFEALRSAVADRTMARSGGCELQLSVLGKAAPARGAAMAALELFFEGIALGRAARD